MPRRRRPHPPPPSASPISIGNCKVEIKGARSARLQHDPGVVTISLPNAASIKISVDRSGGSEGGGARAAGGPIDANGNNGVGSNGYSICLVNPKDSGSGRESLLQEIMQLYKNELPSMNFAANTGKKSQFLERCVSIGKYKTLILRSNPMNMLGEVMASITFQLVPSDTQFAEIPLAAVNSTYQNKGLGHYLVKELKRRLQEVGANTIFCWADKESEGFWLKQGFTSMGNIDSKGRCHRLPIKAEIRRSLCFPGDSTLMVAHLSMFEIPAGFTLQNVEQMNTCAANIKQLKTKEPCCCSQSDSGPCCCSQSDSGVQKKTGKDVILLIPNEEDIKQERLDVASQAISLKNTHGSILLGSSQYQGDSTGKQSKGKIVNAECDNSCSGQCLKRKVWGSSVYSIKSKRVKGSMCGCCSLEVEDQSESPDSNKSTPGQSNIKSGNLTFVESTLNTSSVYLSLNNVEDNLMEHNTAPDQSVHELSAGVYPRVMFMNIADETKKMNLSKIVQNLGGSVTASGHVCTHVITGKARRTLNFCIALCSGALVVSSKWLKESYKEGNFSDGLQFLLEDAEYALKYKSDLKEAVLKAKANPNALLKGYQIYITKHVRPPPGVLSQVIQAAGGTVVPKLKDMREPSKTIFLANEEDMEQAFAAAKEGVWTYNSEWLMSCVMKQELDFGAPQFAESL